MKVVKLQYPIDTTQIDPTTVVLAMGFFDGVHRGHQHVIKAAKQLASKRHQPLAILTYDKLPAIVFKQLPQPVRYLTPLQTKYRLFDQLGVDITYVMDFTSKVGALGPQTFVDDVLVKLHPSAVVAGFDHTYGPKDIANMEKLPGYVHGRFDVVKVPKLSAEEDTSKVSSTRIRQLIDEGQVGDASKLLGYYYLTSGIVVHGFARGRTIGFPTANVQWNADERIPAVGAYTVQLQVQGRWYDGMASVGYNVTFGNQKQKTIEVNLFNFHDQIYGEHVVVRWIKRLRGETKFDGVKGLVDQLNQDRQTSQQILDRLSK